MSATAGLVIVLAAGAGTRMKSKTPKALHPILGRPIIGHVLDAVAAMPGFETRVVVGHGRDAVSEYLTSEYPWARIAIQQEQRGTGDAVRAALAPDVDDGNADDGNAERQGPVLVVAGDAALLTTSTLGGLIGAHADSRAAVTVLTAVVADPAGYGRIVRDESGAIAAIVEDRDADAAQQEINEVNTSIYVFDRAVLDGVLVGLGTDNSQGEFYLTDVVSIARAGGLTVVSKDIGDPQEALGINDRVQLAQAARLMARRINESHMRAGVTLADPDTTWIEPGVVIEPDAVIERNSYLGAGCAIGSGAVIGPDTTLLSCTVGRGATVLRTHGTDARIGDAANVGPFTYLRPGTVLADGAKAGAYVEIKNSTVGPGSKVPHLSYVGDAEIGSGSNIGAATVFVNYDGVAKHHTVVGDEVRIGSDTMLVAPVVVGDGAYTAAGSVVTEDIPPGAIAIGRARQVNVEGWVQRKRAGTKSAAAADDAAAAEAAREAQQ